MTIPHPCPMHVSAAKFFSVHHWPKPSSLRCAHDGSPPTFTIVRTQILASSDGLFLMPRVFQFVINRVTPRRSEHIAPVIICGFKGATQHLREVCSQESESRKFFADVDLDAARSCLVGIVCTRKGRLSSASIDAASDWCFRSFLGARASADHRSGLSHSWPP